MDAPPRVAIACQGGGSHAAFAAGLLRALLSAPMRDRFVPVAFTGTSGGAMCAALAWAGLATAGPDDAIRRLAGFWHELQVHDPLDALANFWAVTLARLPLTEEVSPYTYSPVAEPALRQLLHRHLNLDGIPAAARQAAPALLVGATEVLTGERTLFTGDTLTLDQLIASAAIPPLYRAVAIGPHRYWDGLFATNPPIRELTDLPAVPDEIWVVQINPQRRAQEPRSVRDIDDRRNELAGNLSLAQELYFIHTINKLLKHGKLAGPYRPIAIRVVEMGLRDLDYPSKLDRSPALIRRLMADGADRAGWFFEPRSLWPRYDSLPAKAALPGRAG